MNTSTVSRKLSLRAKLGLSFLSLAVTVLVVGINGYLGARKSEASLAEIGSIRLPSVEALLELRAEAERVRGTMRTLLIPGLADADRARQHENLATSGKRAADSWATYEGLPKTDAEARLWNEFVPLHRSWSQRNDAMVTVIREFDALGISNPTEIARSFERFTKDHHALSARVAARMFAITTDFAGGEDHTACNLGKWLPTFATSNADLAALVHQLEEPHEVFHQTVAEIKGLAASGKIDEAREAYTTRLLPAMEAVFARFDTILSHVEKARSLHQHATAELMGPLAEAQRAMLRPLDAMASLNAEIAATEMKQANGQAAFDRMVALASMVIGSLLATVLGVVVTRSITRPVNDAVVSLATGAESTASSASQVSAASQSLAEGASEQAASLEETTSSLEELASMTRRNAEHASRANSLAREARAAAETGVREMHTMSEAMTAISASGSEIAKIIKTIDEIAFQTNILALNAAVEAARAGEAGLGFAVVAEEVRNLAQRSAVAARETGAKIEAAIQNTNRGVQINASVAQVLEAIVGKVREVDSLVAEVASASGEQSRGIDQVNIAVSEMDKVTQATAASAEESASASEELNAQAEMLRATVAALRTVVEGATKATTLAARDTPGITPPTRPGPSEARVVPKHSAPTARNARPAPRHRAAHANAAAAELF